MSLSAKDCRKLRQRDCGPFISAISSGTITTVEPTNFCSWFYMAYHALTHTYTMVVRVMEFQICGYKIQLTNVRSVKKHTKHSSNTLLCLVCLFTERTLLHQSQMFQRNLISYFFENLTSFHSKI